MSRSVRVLASALLALAVLAPSSASYADPKPLPLPTDGSKPADKADKAVKFPMSSTNFRPFFDKIVSKLEAAAAKSQDVRKPPPPGWLERMKFLASQAMEDGVVTGAEFEQIFNVLRK